MEKIDLYQQMLERRIFNLEKRMKWTATDLWFLKETYKKLYNVKKPKLTIEQLDLFVG